MKVTAIAVALSLLMTSAATASTINDSGTANNGLTLLIYENTGETFLWNRTAVPIQFDGYMIWSEQGLMSPDTWVSISDAIAESMESHANVIANLGSEVSSIGEANPTENSLAELCFGNGPTLQSGARWPLGIISETPLDEDISFAWCTPTRIVFIGDIDPIVEAGQHAGNVVFLVPEPMSLGMLALGGLALLRRRR